MYFKLIKLTRVHVDIVARVYISKQIDMISI